MGWNPIGQSAAAQAAARTIILSFLSSLSSLGMRVLVAPRSPVFRSVGTQRVGMAAASYGHHSSQGSSRSIPSGLARTSSNMAPTIRLRSSGVIPSHSSTRTQDALLLREPASAACARTGHEHRGRASGDAAPGYLPGLGRALAISLRRNSATTALAQ